MGDIVIAAEYKVASLFGEGVAEFKHDAAKGEFVIKPGAGVLGIGKVRGNQGKILKFGLEYPSLVVKFGHAQGIHLQGLYLRINRDPGISLFLGACPAGKIGLPLPVAGRGQSGGKLIGMGLGFVQAEYVGGFPLNPREKAPLFHSPDSVHVPRKYAHEKSI
jgi:hypothetical protein